jgi:hypothetical protein
MYIGRDMAEASDCRGVFLYLGHLYALRSGSLWRLKAEPNQAPNFWSYIIHAPNVGSDSRWSVATDGEQVYWCGRKAGRASGFVFRGSLPMRLSHGVDDLLEALTDAELETAAGGCGKGCYWLSFDKASGTQTLEWYADEQGTWALRDRRALAYGCSHLNSYYGDNAGKVYELQEGTGAQLTASFTSPAFQIVPEYPSDWYHVQHEWKSVSGASISGQFRYDGQDWTTLSGSPFRGRALTHSYR